MKTVITHRSIKAIPFKDIVEANQIMTYGDVCKVIFEILILTGCRIKEIENMKVNMLFPYDNENYVLYWKLGKNQKRTRKELLPKFYVEELIKYREANRVPHNSLFGIKAETFRRYFNRDVRPLLGGSWLIKTPNPERNFDLEFIYQLKYLRKDFWTLDFKMNLDKWKSPEIALQATSKHACHSSTRMTYYHYIQNFTDLDLDSFPNMTPAQILKKGSQKRLLEWV